MVSYSLTMNPFMEFKHQNLNYFHTATGKDRQTNPNQYAPPA